ncbi:MAG: DUF1461 domain-containing protein [Solirubrobacterales bacterium]
MEGEMKKTERRGGASKTPDRLGPLGVVAVVAIPLVLAGNSLILLLIPWLADLQYALPGFPDDPLGLTPDQRLVLAREGIRSIWPVGSGTTLLVEATLPGGSPAFGSDEVRHMEDVRAVVRGALVLWLVAVLAVVPSLLVLRGRGAGTIPVVLKRGAVATVAAVIVVGLFAALSFDTFFQTFHDLLFEPGSWQFPADSTLLALYPTRFWTVATALLVGLTLIQAAILALVPGRTDPD